MKKILCAILVLTLMVCFCACKDEGNDNTNATGDSVDQNTVSLVNVAYDNTEDLVENASALGFKINYRRKLTFGNESDALGLSVTYNFTGKGEGSKFFYETESKSGGTDEHTMMYGDGKNIYGYKAETTYLVSNDNLTADYIGKISENITVFNASDFEVIDTVIMNTSSGGHAFMLTYDIKTVEFDPADVFGPLYAEGFTEYELKPMSLTVSGIIDTEGRITEERVSYAYSYEYEDMTGVDPDNSEAQGVMKNATVKLDAEMYYDYDIESIKVPSEITLLPEEGEQEEETDELRELSLTDFLKIGQQSSDNTKNK